MVSPRKPRNFDTPSPEEFQKKLQNKRRANKFRDEMNRIRGNLTSPSNPEPNPGFHVWPKNPGGNSGSGARLIPKVPWDHEPNIQTLPAEPGDEIKARLLENRNKTSGHPLSHEGASQNLSAFTRPDSGYQKYSAKPMSASSSDDDEGRGFWDKAFDYSEGRNLWEKIGDAFWTSIGNSEEVPGGAFTRQPVDPTDTVPGESGSGSSQGAEIYPEGPRNSGSGNGSSDGSGADEATISNILDEILGEANPPDAPDLTGTISDPTMMPQPEPPDNMGPDPFAQLQEVMNGVAAQSEGMQEQLNAQVQRLRDMYKLSETPREKAQIQFLLDDLEARADAANQMTDKAYDEAINQQKEMAKQMSENAAKAGERVGDVYRQGAEQTANLMEDLSGSFSDNAYGVGGEALGSNATDYVAQLSQAAPREQANTQQIYDIGSGAVGSMGSVLAGEAAAQQAQTQRAAAQQAAQMQAQHNQQVADRIASERQALAGQVGNLQNTFTQEQFNNQDQLTQLGMEMANMANQVRQGYRDRRYNTAQKNAQIMNEWNTARDELELKERMIPYQNELDRYKWRRKLLAELGLQQAGGGQTQDIVDEVIKRLEERRK